MFSISLFLLPFTNSDELFDISWHTLGDNGYFYCFLQPAKIDPPEHALNDLVTRLLQRLTRMQMPPLNFLCLPPPPPLYLLLFGLAAVSYAVSGFITLNRETRCLKENTKLLNVLHGGSFFIDDTAV